LPYGFGVDADTGKQLNLVITLTNNESPPVSFTYTFAAAKCKSTKVAVSELDLVMNTVSWEGASLVIS
jgi:hypothetical protein